MQNNNGIPPEYKLVIALGIIIFFAVVYFAGGGSRTLKLYMPLGNVTSSSEEAEKLIEVNYNDEMLEDLSGGYTGAPKLVTSDDKVFFIPPEYCDGDYLRNFRVIGVNQSRAEEKVVKKGDETVSEYNGAVVVYGFQTTYREDYGKNYNFDYTPYDLTMDYDTSNSYFENMMRDVSNNLNNTGVASINGYDEKYASDDEQETEEEQRDISENIKTEKNPNAVDDSDFRVATVVMEHEIGKDYCTILYCDADSCTVKDLGAGPYNLVTNLNDSALTVCYNNNMYVYSFDEDARSYASKERYAYSLDEFQKSTTFLNTMQGAKYATSTYEVIMDIEYSDWSKGWVYNYLKNMQTHYTFTLGQETDLYTYFSNIVSDQISKDEIKERFVDTKSYVDDAVEKAYKGYKKTFSGCISINNSSYVADDTYGNFKFTNKSNNTSWELENDFIYNMSETSLYGIIPITFHATAKGKVKITIVPKFSVKKEYDYTINDLILTQYTEYLNLKNTVRNLYLSRTISYSDYSLLSDGIKKYDSDLETIYESGMISQPLYKLINDRVSKRISYAIIMQMVITPKSANEDTEDEKLDAGELKEIATKYPSKIAEAYTSDMNLEKFMQEDNEEPDEEDEKEFEDIEEDDITDEELENEFEEDLMNEIQEYLTFNIDLSREENTIEKEDEIYSVTGVNEAKEQFDTAKGLYNKEYNQNLQKFNASEKTGPYAEAAKQNADGLEKIKTDFAKIRDKQLEIDAETEILNSLKAEYDSMLDVYLENADNINDATERVLGSENTDKEKNSMGYYKSIETLLDPESERFGLQNSAIKQDYKDFIEKHNNFMQKCLVGADGMGVRATGLMIGGDRNAYYIRNYMIGRGGINSGNQYTTIVNYLVDLYSRYGLKRGYRPPGKLANALGDEGIPQGYNKVASGYEEEKMYEKSGYYFSVNKISADENGNFTQYNDGTMYNLSATPAFRDEITTEPDFSPEKFSAALDKFYDFDFSLMSQSQSDEVRIKAYKDIADIISEIKKYFEYIRTLYRYDYDRYYFYTGYLMNVCTDYDDFDLIEPFTELDRQYSEFFTQRPDYESEVVCDSSVDGCVGSYDIERYPNDTASKFLYYVDQVKKMLSSSETGNVEIHSLEDREKSDSLSLFDAVLGNNDIRMECMNKQAEIDLQQAKIDQLKAELLELEKTFDNTHYYVALRWQGDILTGAVLAENYKNYDEITAEIDKYIEAYNTLDTVSGYRGDPDKFIQCINDINAAINESGVYEYINHGFDEDLFVENYGSEATQGYMYLAERGDALYGDTALADFIDDLYENPAEETPEETEADYNTALINRAIAQVYGNRGKNAILKRTYDQYTEDCKSMYDQLYDSFKKTTVTDEDGNETEVCDITVENIQNALYTYLIDNFEIYELYNYDKAGNITGTYSIEKSEQSGGVMEENIESSSEATTEPEYADSFGAITGNFDSILSYTQKADESYKSMLCIANALLRGTGCLTEDQQMANAPEVSGAEGDVTSLYYRGYQVPSGKIGEMLTLLDNIKNLYNTREAAAVIIKDAQACGLDAVLRNDVYYYDLYIEKCSQADELYRLLYSAAQAGSAAEKQKYINEFEGKDWLILDDVNVAGDLSSVIKVDKKKITTKYKNIVWNTALITDDKKSNISAAPYELYQLDSNFCVGVAENNGFIIPIGAQKNLDVKSLNAKIKQEINGIGGVENVAYGSEGNVDYLLFSGEKKWFRCAVKTNAKTVDLNNISGYSGKFDCDTGDPHFMEYDRTRITGVNQLYVSSLDRGYIPYDINLKGNDNSSISESPDPFAWESGDNASGSTDASRGIRGAYFKAWSDAKGNVILLGFDEDDMRLEETTVEQGAEATTEQLILSFEFEEDTEETTEARREISDADIYDAHLYVYKFATKKAEIPEKYDDPLSNWKSPSIDLFDAGIELEGPYGKLLQTPVNFFTAIRPTIIMLFYALALLYSIYLGVKLSRAGDDEKQREAKEHIKWFILAIFITHILIVLLYLGKTQMTAWEESVTNVSETVETSSEEEQQTQEEPKSDDEEVSSK